MKINRILAILTTAFLFAASTPCFALWFEISATKEEIKAMGVKIRAEARGPNQVWVELEFKPEGKLKDYSRVDMDISEDKKLLVSATLKEDPNRSKDGNLIFGFWVGRTMLEKTSLSLFVAGTPEKIGGHVRREDSFYRLELKNYVPADLLREADGAHGKAALNSTPNDQLWPPPLDEKLLIGTWVRKNAPIQRVENQTLLILREDHSWNEAEISGSLNEPVRIKKFAIDSIWEVVNVGEKNTQTMLFFKHKEGGSNVWNILKVGVNDLNFSGDGGAIVDFRHYTRCEAQTAAQLNERLKKEEPAASSE